MKFLTPEEARKWCEAHGMRVAVDGFLYYENLERNALLIELTEKPSRIIALANYLVPAWSPDSFQGAIVWISDWGIGDDDSERTGSTIIEQMRAACGEQRPLSEAPGMLFGQNEMAEMYSYFVLPLIFGWDAFVVPIGQDYFVFVSHDEVVSLVSSTTKAHEEALKRLKDWGPKEDTWYLKTFEPVLPK